MTFLEICEAWVRFKLPELPDSEVPEAAKRFYGSSSDGSLFHVIAAREQMVLAGVIEPQGQERRCLDGAPCAEGDLIIRARSEHASIGACRRCGNIYETKVDSPQPTPPQEG